MLNSINASTGGLDHPGPAPLRERITTLQKFLNVRYGWKKEHDFQYPKRFMEPVQEGPAAGKIPGPGSGILEYYRVREWDETGSHFSIGQTAGNG